MRRGTRFVSDSLQFTGTDLGDRDSGTFRRRTFDASEDDGDATSNESDGDGDSDDGEDSEDSDYLDLSGLSPQEREEVLVQSAMRRISLAQATGQADVHLKPEELEALAQRQKRIEAEERAARRKKRHGGGRSDRRKKSEQRIAVPLSQLASASSKKKSSPPQPAKVPSGLDALSRQTTGGGDVPADGRDRPGYPPIGYFPPPSASRSRPRAGTSLSQRPPSLAHNEYGYGSSRTRSAVGSLRATQLDPFQYQTGGPRASDVPGTAAAPSRRHASGPSAVMREQRRSTLTPPGAARSSHGSRRASYGEDTSEAESSRSEEDSSSDGRVEPPIREPANKPTGGRGRSSTIVVEKSPERVRSKKKSSSPVKRKQVAGKKKK
ncbi:uncharacterized protein MAM_05845 [Metarhizium album ARSEF 1941]|uniref:COPII vesicles protein Yip3 n=1 Tax=Metarhizium album (strain ARSEF 1941) TaxID=1081103 RepID=A0A0B2WRN9_METAS|nr:uncharacterized protein MAM_05845 [Metarhizium album ARSEF 1941]KHN96259.1 hypothetical protein MAM_05845 [Metarhizium album ARSEF 1941]